MACKEGGLEKKCGLLLRRKEKAGVQGWGGGAECILSLGEHSVQKFLTPSLPLPPASSPSSCPLGGLESGQFEEEGVVKDL